MIANIRIRQIGALFSEGYAVQTPVSLGERLRRRDSLFGERLFEALERRLLCWLRALRPSNLPLVLSELRQIFGGGPGVAASLPALASEAPDSGGLCGPVMDFSPDVLAEGYAQGLYLGAGPAGLRWWSPEQRFVVAPEAFRAPRSIRDSQNLADLSVSFDRDFEATLIACEQFRSTSSGYFLLPPQGLAAICHLFDSGFAHSFEVRDGAGALVAGGFGIAIGRTFLTHALFGQTAEALLGFTVLNKHLARWGFALHETLCTDKRAEMGFVAMSRTQHARALRTLTGIGQRTRWRADPVLSQVG